MATAVEVMKYMKARKSLYGEVQLQKLVYYAQAWSLVWDGQPLFPERIEAWRMGPVVPALRFRTDQPDASLLSGNERATVDAVLAFYGDMNGGVLASRTHKEAPWKDVWGDRSPRDYCDDEITLDAMRRFYTSEAIAGQGPKRADARAEVIPDEDVTAIAAANAERWRGALELLGR